MEIDIDLLESQEMTALNLLDELEDQPQTKYIKKAIEYLGKAIEQIQAELED